MLHKHPALSVIVLLAAALVFGWSPAAQADQTFHTTRYPLSSVVGGSPHGWVIDIHTQGPTIYAQERYLLQDVMPGQTYAMNLYGYSDPSCTKLVVPIPGTATMTANAAGVARGQTTFDPASVQGLTPGTYYLRWQVTDSNGSAVYQTACVPVALD